MKFGVPRIWREPTDHVKDCYFCLVDMSKRRTRKGSAAVTYPSIPSSIAPVPHSSELPVLTPPERNQVLSQDNKPVSEEDIQVREKILQIQISQEKKNGTHTIPTKKA